jgi:hypothetical protein
MAQAVDLVEGGQDRKLLEICPKLGCSNFVVTPAKVGVQFSPETSWIPAFAGMTA